MNTGETVKLLKMLFVDIIIGVFVTVKELREALVDSIEEARGALKMLNVLKMRLVLGNDQKIEEIITKIRIIRGVATVNQVHAVQRQGDSKRLLDILVTFDPESLDELEYVDAAAALIKRIDDVKFVIIHSLNDVPMRDSSGQKRLVY